MKQLAWLRRLLVGSAVAVLALLGTLLVLEHGDFFTRLVRERLVRELGPLGERLTLEHVALHWFEPGLELTGLALLAPGQAAASDLELERVHLTFSRRAYALRFEQIRSLRIEGGRLLLGQRVFDEWSRLATERAQRDVAHTLPPASVQGLQLALELFDRTPFELGTLELCARPGATEGVELAGRLAPSLGGAITGRDPIRLSGALTPEAARVWASARELVLVSRALPSGARVRALPEGTGRLTLDSFFEFVYAATPAGAARPRGHLRAALAEGRVGLRAGALAVEDIALQLEAELEPAPGADPWSREAWDARATLAARVDAAPLALAAEFGRDVPGDAWLRAFGQARDVPLASAALADLGLEEHAVFVREMLDPRGRLDLAGTLELGRNGAGWTHDLALQARARGEVELAYRGFPGDPGSGVPLTLTEARGELVAAARSGGARPWRLCGLELAAGHGSGTLGGWIQLTAPPRGPLTFALPELDLVLSTPSLAVDSTLTRALGENHYLSWIVPDFAPENGTLAGDLRLRSGPEIGGTSATGTLRLHGVSLRWKDVPVQMDGIDGELELRWARTPSAELGRPLERHRPLGVAYRLDNRGGARVGAAARVQGWVREEPLPSEFDPATRPRELLQELHIDMDELGLRGRDFDVLAARFPALRREVNDYGAVGRMRVRFRGAQPSVTLPFQSEIEATPLEVHVRPQFFQRQTRDLRGRILIQTEESPVGELSASQLVLTGTWPGGVELYADGVIPAQGDARVHVYGAGIDPTNTSFKGALITTLASNGPNSGGIDLSSWTLAGAVDFALLTTFDPASPAPARNRYRIQLRDNDLRAEELLLRDLHGTFEQEDEVMTSPLVEATLGGHALEFRDVRTFPLAQLARVPAADPWLAREGFWQDANGRALQADVYTRDLPLDAEHLAGLLEPEALASLRATPSWRGALDVLGARLLVTSEADERGKVAVRGALRAHDLALRLGLPIRIDSARVELQELVLEQGRFRGWARISELQAHIAERVLSSASMIAGYVDGRLTVDNLSGDFEGGRLESLGGALGSASKALGIDLSEPYRFDVAMRLAQVSVGGLLRGVFQSSIADEGVLDASLQLSGTPAEVLALTGRGSLSLNEGALWSIPVMRALFARLGFERGGLFDRMRARFELRNGRLQVSHLEIQSALLDLVGTGWQDLDGRLAYDLEVRYGLLDRLGVFGRLLYWLNNSLMRVAVRGDFERPQVRIRNSILELLTGFDEAPPRHLPLPPFSALGPRF